VNQLDARHFVSEDQLKLAAALLQSGNRRGYEQLRQTKVATLNPTDIASDYRTFKLGLLLPPEPNLLHRINLAAELVGKNLPTAKAVRPTPLYREQSSEALALLEYRQGHFDEAINSDYRYVGSPAYSAARKATMSLISAMAQWRLGDHQKAVVRWTQGYELILTRAQQGLALGGTRLVFFPGTPEDLEGSWYDWVIADLLRRECDELFSQSDRSLDSMSRSDADSKDIVVAITRSLGAWHAIGGDWAQARNRYSQLPDGGLPNDCLLKAIIALKLGDERGFLRIRDEAIQRFKDTTDTENAYLVMQAGLLRPIDGTSAAALEPFAHVLERSVAGAGPLKGGAFKQPTSYLILLGLFDYRRGNYSKALDSCQLGFDASPYVPMPAAMAKIILALSFHAVGDDARSRAELDGAKSLVQGGLNLGFDSWNWGQWLFVHLLFQNAEGLISDAPLPTSGGAPR
jgi:tetratricopeptide (TPR) repeat protein